MAAVVTSSRWRFSSVPGVMFNYAAKFEQDPTYKATTAPCLNLIENFEGIHKLELSQQDQSNLKPWEKFKAFVQYLNGQSQNSVHYKVLYITRHGLGYHNVFEAQVGRDAWNNHWSHLDGDGTTVWADSRLNEAGKKQVLELGTIWAGMVSDDKVPLPEAIYTSPLTRCLETTDAIFHEVFRQQGVEFRPIIKELLRERLTDHTCDRRSNRSVITTNFPDYFISPDLSEEDTLWRSDRFETQEEHMIRKQQALEDIFNHDSSQFISLTTHSYAISAILEVLGMRGFRVREGSSIAIFVKGEKTESGHD